MNEPLPGFDDERWRDLIRGMAAAHRFEQVLGTVESLLFELQTDRRQAVAKNLGQALDDLAVQQQRLATLFPIAPAYAQRIAQLSQEEFEKLDAKIEAVLARVDASRDHH